MPNDDWYRNHAEMIAGAELCLQNKLRLPMLVLTYSLIDAFAWVVYGGAEERSGTRFIKWVDEWVQPTAKLPCTATELYAARCGVLHTLTSESKLSKDGRARQVAYAWGDADPTKAQRAIDGTGLKGVVFVSIEGLLAAVREGMAKVLEASETDAALRKRLHETAQKQFGGMKVGEIDAILEHIDKESAV